MPPMVPMWTWVSALGASIQDISCNKHAVSHRFIFFCSYLKMCFSVCRERESYILPGTPIREIVMQAAQGISPRTPSSLVSPSHLQLQQGSFLTLQGAKQNACCTISIARSQVAQWQLSRITKSGFSQALWERQVMHKFLPASLKRRQQVLKNTATLPSQDKYDVIKASQSMFDKHLRLGMVWSQNLIVSALQPCGNTFVISCHLIVSVCLI